jgi:ketosteroid isomerase-like protein
MKTKYWLLFVAVAFMLGALANSQSDPSAALVKIENDFMKAAADHGSQGYMSYYADDAVEVPNGEAFLQGKENIAKTMGFLDQPDNHLTWAPVGAGIAASGDLGYTYGTYEFSSKDKDGKPVVNKGKYATIWKKQKDGSWKVAMDMGNAGQCMTRS